MNRGVGTGIVVSITSAVLLAILFRGGDRAGVPRKEALFPGVGAVVDSITIRNDSLDFKAVPLEGIYLQERPAHDRADLDRVVEMITFLRRAPIARIVEKEAKEMGDYGLEPPGATVGLDGMKVRIGSANPVGDGIYASVEGSSKVLLVGKGFGDFASLGPESLRDPIPVRFPLRGVTTVDVRIGEKTICAKRRGKGGWFLVNRSLRASPASVWRIVATVASARINRFDPERIEPGGDRIVTVVLEWEGGRDSLVIGEEVPGTALRRATAGGRPGSFLIPGRVADSVVVHTGTIVERHLFEADPLGADRVVISLGSGDLIFRRAGAGGWMVTAGTGKERPARTEAVRALLRNLRESEAAGVLGGAVRDGVFRADGVIRVDNEVVEIDGRVDGAPLARREGEEGVFLLGEGLWNSLRRAVDGAAVPGTP